MSTEGRDRGLTSYAAVALVACAVLVLEISLTRILSVLLRYHFVFLVISAAMCGLGLGGMLCATLTRGARDAKRDARVLALLATAAAASVPGTLLALFCTDLVQRIFNPLTVPAVSLLPFVLCGAFVAYAFDRAVARAGRMYFADLSGAAVGALAVVLILNALGGINAALASSLLLAAAALIHWRRLGWPTRGIAIATAALCVGLLVANRSEDIIGLKAIRFSQDQPGAAETVKPLFSPLELAHEGLGSRIVATDWNAFARTDVVSNEGDPTLYVYTDGDVPTNMLEYDGTAASLSEVPLMVGFAGFMAGPRDNVLLIGPGGGLDIHMGTLAGAGRMTGVELSPSIPKLMYDFREHNGSVYATEGFSLFVDEGRSFIRRRDESYDLIYTALTKTATTSTSGLTLMESYLFTVEAFRDYLEHLTPNGRIVLVLDREPLVRRALLTAVQALTEEGKSSDEAMRHCALVALPRAEGTLKVLAEVAAAHGIDPIAVRTAGRAIARDPGIWWRGPYSHMLIVFRTPLDEAGARKLERTLRRPWLDREALAPAMLAVDPFLAAAMPQVEQWVEKGQLTEEDAYRVLRTRVDEMCGLEMMFVPWLRETHEGLTMLSKSGATVEEYAESREGMNLAPVQDDRPFFLDMSPSMSPALKRLLIIPALALAASLVLLAITVLLPGRRDTGDLGGARGRLQSLRAAAAAKAFGYFALLGVGFMLVEVPLAQKLVVFLAYPTLTISVVIFGLLVGGGLGSLWSQTRPESSLVKVVQGAGFAAAGLGVAHAFAVPWLLDHMLGLPVLWRALAALGLVLPLGAALGVPFPAGLRLAGVLAPGLTPRLWGINGIMSTTGTVLAMLAAWEVGFTRSLLLGCVVYLLAVLVVPALAPVPQREATQATSAV